MRNTKPTIILTFLLGTALLLASCDGFGGGGFLDRYPLDSPSPETFFVDESSAQQAVTAAYYPWARGSSHMYRRDFVIMSDAMSDDGHWRPSRGGSIQQAAWNIHPDHGAIDTYWTQAYRSVNAANYAIERIPTLLDRGLSQEQIAPYIAEAHFMRGFSYLYLVTFYGEVPLIDSPLSSFDEFDQPRAPVEAVYDQIIADFTHAKNNLPPERSEAGRATKAAAAAYLAKALLYREDYPAAEQAAREAIQIAEESGYYLVDDYMSIFDIDNEPNPEVLFYLSYIDNHPDQGNNDMVQRLARDVPPEISHVWGAAGWGYHLPQRDLYDAYEEGDPRRGYTIFAPGDDFGIYTRDEPFTYEHQVYNENCEVETYEKTYTNGDVVEYDYRWATPTGMNVRKGIYNIGHLANERWAGKDVPLMRMGELYLILAEALAEQGKGEALEWVNQVRARGSVDMPAKTASDGDLVELVRHERRVELGMEGHRLWDLIRWRDMKEEFGAGTEVKRHFYADCLPASDERKYDDPNLDNYPGERVLFPIPQDELDQNENIHTQNPGY